MQRRRSVHFLSPCDCFDQRDSVPAEAADFGGDGGAEGDVGGGGVYGDGVRGGGMGSDPTQ